MNLIYKSLLYTTWTLSIFAVGFCRADQAKLSVGLGYPTMKVEDGKKLTNHLHVSLTGFELKNEKSRASTNIAIVIDKSGSMQGEKIEQARNAAISAIDRMSDNDIVSIVTYDDNVQVLVPATKASDRQAIKKLIGSINADGSTALFAGVSKGAAEVRKFLDSQRVNRVILLSDGMANIGPSNPSDLEQLGGSLIKEGISVTTMGLGSGYNEDLMSRLARAGSGNHVFIENAAELVNVFQREFDDVMSVVAKDIRIQIKMAEGVRAVKVLNDSADINGQIVELSIGQLYSNQERYFVVEIEIPSGVDETESSIATVTAKYNNLQTNTTDDLSSKVGVRFTSNDAEVEKSINKKVLANCVLQIGNAQNRRATELRDQGREQEAESLLRMNCEYLGDLGKKLNDDRLVESSAANGIQASNLDDKNWNVNRKLMRQRQYKESTNQSYESASELAR